MKKYAILTKSGNDEKGDVYRVIETDTLQQAYSVWIREGTNGEVIKIVDIQIKEA